MKWIDIMMIWLALLLAATAASAQLWPFDSYGDAAAITVRGEGSVSVPPDSVIMSVTVETSGENSSVATAQNKRRVDQTLDALFDAGVKEEEILSRSSGSSRMGYASMVIENNSTNVSRQSISINRVEERILFSVDTTDSSRIRELREAAVEAGANDTSIAGYGIADEKKAKEAYAEAQKKAIENARANAEMMASAEGVQVGKALNIMEYPSMNGAGYASGDIDSVDVTAAVVVTYEIDYN